MNNSFQNIIFIAIIFVFGACYNKSETIKSNSKISNPKTKDSSLKVEYSKNDLYDDFLPQREETLEGYNLKFGFEDYNEDKYGFENPGYFHVFKNGKLIFKDTFKGEGDVYIKSLGHHNLSGDKLFFTLNWGTEACDYSHYTRYYFINPEGNVYYINEYWSMASGDGYSNKSFRHIFPGDNLGKPDSLIIIEGINFLEQDQPDLYDTSKISFNGENIKINKTTNNLNKAK